MGTKMKGVLKGLRYITQIFEDEKEPEMQIGYPTDVKHVAHIGWDGPSVNESPSWMKKYKSPQGLQIVSEEATENPELRWGSQDSRRRSSELQNNPTSDFPTELPKSSRSHSLTDGSLTSGSPKTTKSKQSRRNSSDSSQSTTRKTKDPGQGTNSPSRILPGLPKKSHRKKSKESSAGGSSRSSRSKPNRTPISYSSALSNPELDSIESTSGFEGNRFAQSSSLRPNVKEEDKG